MWDTPLVMHGFYLSQESEVTVGTEKMRKTFVQLSAVINFSLSSSFNNYTWVMFCCYRSNLKLKKLSI